MPKGRRQACRVSLIEEQILFGVIKSDVRGEEANALARIRVDQLPNVASQYRANNDVRVENDHLSELSASRDATV